MIRPACILLLVVGPATSAVAGGTGTSTGSDSTGAADGTTTEGGSSSETSSDMSSTSDGSCGQCSPGVDEGMVMFFGITNGAVIESEATFQVGATPSCACDDCGCYDDDASQIRLQLDAVDTSEPCAATSCEFTISVLSGTHTLAAIATYDFGEVSTAIEIEGPAATDESGSETGPAGADDEKAGCGCRADTRVTAAEPMALVLIAGLARRRARRT